MNTQNIDIHILKGTTPTEECYSGFGGREVSTRESLEEVLKKAGVQVVKIV
jgi:hypothetical protein